MDKQKCQRCNEQEYIPTHQYLKFEEKRYDLCSPCWSTFNEWLYGTAIKESKPNPGRLYSSGVVVGKELSGEIVTGRDPGKSIKLKEDLFGKFRRWFFADDKRGLLEKLTD